MRFGITASACVWSLDGKYADMGLLQSDWLCVV